MIFKDAPPRDAISRSKPASRRGTEDRREMNSEVKHFLQKKKRKETLQNQLRARDFLQNFIYLHFLSFIDASTENLRDEATVRTCNGIKSSGICDE